MINLSDTRLGILGGGQLGKMLCLEASNWHVQTHVLDPLADCPSATVCSSFTRGDFKSYDDVYKFGKTVDVLTIEIEHVNTDALERLENEGLEIRPAVNILRTIQDKGKQKEFYTSLQIPTAGYSTYSGKEGILNAIGNGDINLPFVQKSRTLGYDGKGVNVVKTENDLDTLLEGPCIVEDCIRIKKEISVIAARNGKGEVKCFPPVEMVFNQKANLVEFLISPPDITEQQTSLCMDLARRTIEAFGLNGILAVEMFLDEDERLMVNEVAPRPHNSGHHTIESCITSQYEQYLRCLLDLPLAEPGMIMPSVMVNILGEPGYEGEAKYTGLRESLSVNGAKIHIYGKSVTRPFRKMGHVTIIDTDQHSAMEKAKYVKDQLKVIS